MLARRASRLDFSTGCQSVLAFLLAAGRPVIGDPKNAHTNRRRSRAQRSAAPLTTNDLKFAGGEDKSLRTPSSANSKASAMSPFRSRHIALRANFSVAPWPV